MQKLELESKEFIGDLPCFDIMVDHPDHLFVLANDLICSNSGAYSAKKQISGLPYIEAFVGSPETFPDRASVSTIDGKITKIADAPQGGKYIFVNDQPHYVLPNTDIDVKVGDKVEAGDIMSDGLADPEDIIRYKGIGEGRKYYAERFAKLLADSGAPTSARNAEMVSRSAINSIRITDPDGYGNYLPDDIVSYDKFEANYTPRESSKEWSLKKDKTNVVGKYLEKPVLHYSIGTRITPKVINKLNEAEIDNILVNDEPPGFEPVFIRAQEITSKNSDDWLARLQGSYLKSNIIDSAIKGLDTNIKENINPYARIGQGSDFADKVTEKGLF